MRFTSASANKYLNQLNAEKDLIVSRERDVATFTAATVEKLEEVAPEYDFVDTQAKLFNIEDKIVRLKHALNVFNTNTVLEGFLTSDGGAMTVDSALVYMSILNQKISKFERMSKTEPKRSYSYNNGLIVYAYANYSVEAAKSAYEASQTELHALQLALDKVNNTVEFEVNLD